jgi:hypothetical protein
MQMLKKRLKTRRFWLTVAPLLILLVLLGVYNLLILRQNSTAVATNFTPTQPRPTQTPLPEGTRAPILLATILPSPTPTLTPRPNVPETAVITLLGPPDESSLPQNGRLAFYWSYPAPLQPRQQFVLILHQEESMQILGTLDQPNFGELYQLLVDFDDIEPVVERPSGSFSFKGIDEKQLLLASEERQILFLPE